MGLLRTERARDRGDKKILADGCPAWRWAGGGTGAARDTEEHKLQIALFTLGPIKKDEKDWTDVQAQLDKELSKYSWLKPVASELFGGKYDPAKLRFPFKLLATMPASPLHQLPASDVRDWEKIRAWAAGLARKL